MQAQTEALSQQKARVESCEVDKILVDVDSGSNFERKSFKELEQAIKKGQCKKVVVTRLDRLGRSVIGIKTFIDLCTANDVEIMALDDKIDTNSVSGRFHINMLASFGEMELDRIKERISHGHKYHRQKNLPYKAVFGYKKECDTLVLNYDEYICLIEGKKVITVAEFAREYIDIFLEKKTFKGTIKAMINKYGVIGFMSHSSLSNWLSNPQIRGILVYGRGHNNRYSNKDKWDYRGELFPSLLSQEEWDEIEIIFKNIAENRTNYRSTNNYAKPFGSLLKCSYCNGSAQTISGGKARNITGYQCVGYRTGKCQNNKWINHKKLRGLITKLLIEKAKEIVNTLEVEESETLEEKKLQSEIFNLKKISQPSTVILNAIKDLEFQLETFKLNRLNNRNKQSELQDKLINTFTNGEFYSELENNLTSQELKEFYRLFIDKISFKDGEIVSVDFLI
ncbi:DNA-invertase [Geminocystis sp. NIES-3709]|nr:DNA-invertase [Geminocystis sp. NIES-3709]